MNFLGSIIKASIGLNQRLTIAERDEIVDQDKQLKELLAASQATAFGKYHGFSELLGSSNARRAFAEEVPISEYESFHSSWLSKQQQFKDITWPGHPDFFALSSGTTSPESKRIPITDDLIQSVRSVGVSLIKDLPNYDFDEELFESEVLMLSSSAALAQSDNGFSEGEISGINVSNFPTWYDLFYRPGKEIAAIPDWEERIARITEQAPEWNIGAIAGIPSWVLVMIKRIIKRHGVSTIHDIWPNLRVFVSGGVAFDTYRKDFELVCREPIHIMDTYLASEGFFAYTDTPDTLDMKLATHHGYYYEFIPFNQENFDSFGNLIPAAKAMSLGEVQVGEEYALLVSSCAGLWRYFIGDTIKITSKQPTRIRLTGRTKFWLNVAGSQLSEEKLDQAVNHISEIMDQPVNEYSIAALPGDSGEYVHTWVMVVSEPKQVNSQEIAQKLDAFLKDINKNYKVARDKAVSDVVVRVISKEKYHSYLSKEGKMGGQSKTPKVMDEQKMRAYIDFLQS